jgi:hypothetical protein
MLIPGKVALSGIDVKLGEKVKIWQKKEIIMKY